MLLTVKKQIEETVELKTPAYYKNIFGHYFISENGAMVAVKKHMVFVWDQSYGHVYAEAIEEMLRVGELCDRAEFDAAYSAAMQKIQSVVDGVEINS